MGVPRNGRRAPFERASTALRKRGAQPRAGNGCQQTSPCHVACPVVGGNISRGAELSVTTTVLGRSSRPIPRSGARPGEELWLVGELGMAAAGLSALRLGQSCTAVEVVREPSAALARCILAWRRPQALLAAGRAMLGRASAVIDVSDGLLADAPRLAEQSRVRLIIERERLRAGRINARSRGVRVGRPSRAVDVARARELLGEGRATNEVASVMGVSPRTLRRHLSIALQSPG